MSLVEDQIFGESPREQRFNPESDFYTFPLDPYHDRLIQFTALKQMGYPVELQCVGADELPEEWVQDDVSEWEVNHFPFWIRPVVTVLDFERYVEDPDVPGDFFETGDKELDDLLQEHPVGLVHRVDTSDVCMLAYDLVRYEKGVAEPLVVDGRVTKTYDLLAGCFMAALDRYTDRKAQGYPFWQDKGPLAVSDDDYERYSVLKELGFKPISPEQLGSIAMDYYDLVEQVEPDFAEFKGAKS